MRQAWTITLIFLVLIAISCSGGSLTTREKGAGIGGLGGAAIVGGIIGAAVGIREQVQQSAVRSGLAPAY